MSSALRNKWEIFYKRVCVFVLSILLKIKHQAQKYIKSSFQHLVLITTVRGEITAFIMISYHKLLTLHITHKLTSLFCTEDGQNCCFFYSPLFFCFCF